MTAQEGRLYKPDGESLRRYMLSAAPVTCIQGPVRSGKSVASCMRLYKAMMAVPKDPVTGKRRSRWLVIRDTYPNLEESTVRTWLEWFPEEVYGRFTWGHPMIHEIRFGDIEADVIFEAFDGDSDIPKLKSREYTGAWINEAQFFSLNFAVAVFERTGWFPSPDGEGFLQLDMNAPPLGHWAPIMRGEAPIPEEMTASERIALVKPDSWEFFTQPAWFTERKDESGAVLEYEINPKAENLNVVGVPAVQKLLEGRTKDKIDADLMNRVLILQPGRPVFPMFSREDHVSKHPLSAVEGVVIDVGLDFGRNPAMVASQCVAGQWRVLDELCGQGTAAVDFAPKVKKRLAQKFPGFRFRYWGDPSGSHKRAETNDETSFEIFESHGMKVRAADTGNRRTIRLETMTSVLNRRGGILFSCDLPVLITGAAGGYCYRRLKVTGSPVYEDEPDKRSAYSHPMDALQEILLGGGEARVMLNKSTEKKRPTDTLTRARPFHRGRSRVSEVLGR